MKRTPKYRGNALKIRVLCAIYCLLKSQYVAKFMPGDEGNESHEGNARHSLCRFTLCALSSFVQMTARISYVALGPQKADIVVLHEH